MAKGEPKSESLEDNKQPRNWLNGFGFTLTGAYLLFLVPLALSRWDHLWALHSNEFGDLMAGTFAPLAFLWLVIGYFQQGRELKVSNETLKLQQQELASTNQTLELQRQELAASVEALEKQSTEMQKSAEAAITSNQIREAELKRDKEDKRKHAAPILELKPNGHSTNGGDGTALYSFRMANYGSEITGFNWSVRGGYSLRVVNKLSKGDVVKGAVTMVIAEPATIEMTAAFLDGAGDPREKIWLVEKVGPNFTITELED